MVDQDYWDKLSPDEARWLAEFNDCWVGGDFRGQTQRAWPQTLRREVWSRKHAALEDGYGQAELFGAVQVFSETGRIAVDPRTDPTITSSANDPARCDLRPTPEYLSSDEYKAAREAFRAQLSPTRKPKTPKPSRKLDHAQLVLAMVTPANGTDNDEQ